MDDMTKCPFTGGTPGRMNRDWWPNQLNIGLDRVGLGVDVPRL